MSRDIVVLTNLCPIIHITKQQLFLRILMLTQPAQNTADSTI